MGEYRVDGFIDVFIDACCFVDNLKARFRFSQAGTRSGSMARVILAVLT